MTWVDYAVFGVTAASLLWGAWRGLVREVMSLAGWVIAFLAANLLAGPVAETLPQSITRPELRLVVAYIAVFVFALLTTKLFGLVVAKLVEKVGLGGVDRALGGLFGLLRAALIVVAFALLSGLTALPTTAAWKESLSGPWLAAAALALAPWLPPALTERLRYH